MTESNASEEATSDLLRYLDVAREALIWKLDGLGDYDLRRPMTPTGTNLLGLVKHTAGVEAGYLGEVFGRPFPDPMPWTDDDAELGADMWATAAESADSIVDLYRRVGQHSAATVHALALDAVGQVPWWPAERREVTLHRILVHVIAETNRHAGHADILRETIDGAVGLREGNTNLEDGYDWATYRARLEEVARQFR